MRHGTAQSEATRNTGWGYWERVGDWRVGCPSSHDITQMALFSLSLSGSDVTWLRGPSNPCPHPRSPNKSLSSLTDVQQQAPPCQRAPAPKQTPDCNPTPPPQQQLTYLDCEILTDPDSSWNPPKTGDCQGCMFISVTQLPGLSTVPTGHVFTHKDACSTQACELRRIVSGWWRKKQFMLIPGIIRSAGPACWYRR